MKRPIESDYTSHIAYTRALEKYCDTVAQPEQEPVLEFYEYEYEGKTHKVYRWLVDVEAIQSGTKLYTTPPQRKPKVTSNFIRKGIEASRLNVELLSALSACLDWMEQLRTSGDAGGWLWMQDSVYIKGRTIEAKLKENT